MEIRFDHVDAQKPLPITLKFLEAVQWKTYDLPPYVAKSPVIRDNLAFDLGPIIMRELHAALRKAKNHKVPGLDEVPVGFFKYLDDENRQILLSVLNDWWSHGSLSSYPFSFSQFCIFKQGATDKLLITDPFHY